MRPADCLVSFRISHGRSDRPTTVIPAKAGISKGKGGAAGAWRDIIYAAMRLQSLNALGQAGLLIGAENVIRADAPSSEEKIQMDDWKLECAELPGGACRAPDELGVRINEMFPAIYLLVTLSWQFHSGEQTGSFLRYIVWYGGTAMTSEATMADNIEDFIGDLDRALRRFGYTIKTLGASQGLAEGMRTNLLEKQREDLVQNGLDVIDGIAGGLSEEQRTECEEIIRKLMEAAKWQ